MRNFRHASLFFFCAIVPALFSGCSSSGGSSAAPVTTSPTYTVTYNGNGHTGGSVPIDSTNYQQGQTVTVPGNTGNLVKTGYSFAGWNTQANGSGTTYAQGQTFSMGAANVTLYAKWQAGQAVQVSGTAVDPYIVGATFFEDKNNNGLYDAGELLSSATNSSGVFTFDTALTRGSTLLIKDMGIHNGVAYTGEIMRTVDQDNNLVISPITTLLANGWTTDQIISVLTHTTGLQGITAADLTKDPLAGIETLDQTTLTAAHFRNVWATTAIHSFLSIMQHVLVGSGQGYHITYAMFSNPSVSVNGQTPQWYVDRMVERIGMGLDPHILTDIDNQLATATSICTSAGLPAPPRASAGDVIRGSTVIADYVIKKVIQDLTYAPTLAEYGPWRMELGRDFYIIRNKNNPCITGGIQNGALPNVTACTSFKLDIVSGTTPTVVCITN